MPTPATLPTHLSSPTTPNPAGQAALAELLEHGLVMVRVARQLAEVESQALDVLGQAAALTARALMAPHASLAEATAAGRDADINDAARDAIAARFATITDSFDKACRAVRRTVALQARIADCRPVRQPGPEAAPTRLRAVPAAVRRPANDAERADRLDPPELDDEIAGQDDAAVLCAIRRDLDGAALPAASAAAAEPPQRAASSPPGEGARLDPAPPGTADPRNAAPKPDI